MGKKTHLSLNVPVNMQQLNWGKDVLKSYLHNAKIIYKREHKSLLKEIEAHGRKIYDLVIAEYYASYTPKYYDRHYTTPGHHPGFNLYRANNFIIDEENIVSYDFNSQYMNLLPYYSFWQKKNYNDGNGFVKRGYGRFKVFLMVLAGKRKFPQWAKDEDGNFKKDDDGKRYVVVTEKQYSFKVPYGPLHKTFSGKPYQILNEAAERLVLYYNRELIKRIREGIEGLEVRWVK